MKLTQKQLKAITSSVSDVFGRMRARLLGRIFSGPSITFSVETPDPMLSLEAIYRHAGSVLYGPSFKPDRDNLDHAIEITSNYLEAERLKTLNKVVKGIEQAKNKAEAASVIKDELDRASGYVNMLAVTEARTVQAYAERDGIVRVAADMGIDDPLVAFLGRVDAKTCKYCLAMYHMPGNWSVPRVYKLSEVHQGYFRAKDWDGQEIFGAPLHPNCRHVMTFVPPGYGFDDAGHIKFVGPGYDLLAVQRGETKKNEPMLVGRCGCSSHPADPCEPEPNLELGSKRFSEGSR